MEYIPEYARGQMLVRFKTDKSEGFARDFAVHYKCKLAEGEYGHGDAYVYNVSKGR